MDQTQRAYENAIAQIPPEELEVRHKAYHDYLNEHLTPIIEQIDLINSVQLFDYVEREDGWTEKVYQYTPDSKIMVDALKEQAEKVKQQAVDNFWEGYEYLKEGIEV